jgi:hypothetical protein
MPGAINALAPISGLPTLGRTTVWLRLLVGRSSRSLSRSLSLRNHRKLLSELSETESREQKLVVESIMSDHKHEDFL